MRMPPAPHRAFASGGVSKAMMFRGSETPGKLRVTTSSAIAASQPDPGWAQCSAGSIADEAIRKTRVTGTRSTGGLALPLGALVHFRGRRNQPPRPRGATAAERAIRTPGGRRG